jgi:predicted HicB family RNase H-like nuclease
MTKHQSEEEVKNYNVKLPASLHKKLVDLAVKERRSLADQIIYMLEKALKASAD